MKNRTLSRHHSDLPVTEIANMSLAGDKETSRSENEKVSSQLEMQTGLHSQSGSFRRRFITAGVNRLWDGVPFYLLAAMLVVIVVAQPDAFSVMGFALLLGSCVPLALATMSQMFIMAAGDIDLGIGSFVGLINVITAVVLIHNTALGVLLYLVLIVAYVIMGLIVYYLQIPALIVTLGAGFIWLGLAINILPSPAGTVPSYIINFFSWNPSFFPGPAVYLVAIALIGHFILMRNRYGAILRGSGSNAEAIGRAGWSVARTKATLYALAGVFGVLSGLSLSALTTSGDSANGSEYVLLSIVSVIIGGGEFTGGVVAPVGAVAGACVIVLVGSMLSFLNISSNYQIGAQGVILMLALSIRVVRRTWGSKKKVVA